MLIRNFTKCTDEVKAMLFKTFCCNFYCANLWWNFNSATEHKFRVSFNRGLRLFLKLNQCIYNKNAYEYYNASNMFLTNNIDTFDILLRKSMFNFSTRINVSKNNIVEYLANGLNFLNSYFSKGLFKKLYA